KRAAGVLAVQVAVGLALIMGLAALAVDVGLLYNSVGQMQVAVDAGSLAGASALLVGTDDVHVRANYYTGLHRVAGETLEEAPDTHVAVSIGNWYGLSQAFVPGGAEESVKPNAVRVVGTRNELPMIFGSLLGIPTREVQRQAVSVLGGGKCLGIWGIEGVWGDGDLRTDSYNSTEGSYGGGNVYPNGDVCSGSDITLNGSSVVIRGDAMYGLEHDLITEGSPEIVGVVDELCCPLVPPAVAGDVESAASNNDNASIGLTERGRDPFAGSQWDFYVTGSDSLALPGGTFYFTSAVIDGTATVTVSAPTVIYLSGPAAFTGNGLINLTEDPKNLIIYSTGETMILDGTAGFYGVVIAPNADIVLAGTGEYFGVLVGETLDIDGTADIHVDEAAVLDIMGFPSAAPVIVQ
ncbi:MAG: DUF7305 domain-containing protein, partial [Planctomycetota bacterium]